MRFLLALSLVFVSLQSFAGTLRSTGDLTSPWLVTDAGKVLNLPGSVDSRIDYQIALGRLTVAGWQATEVCEDYGPSPNGEPELAECLRYARVWSPKLVFKNVALDLEWTVADLSGRRSVVADLDVSSCIVGRGTLEIKQQARPSQDPPRLTFDGRCQAYAYEQVETTLKSRVLADSNVSVELKFGAFLRFTLGSNVVIDGRADDGAQAALENSVMTDASYTQLIFDPLLNKGGDTIRLFNYPEVLYYR